MSNTIPNRQVICQVLLDRAKEDKAGNADSVACKALAWLSSRRN